MSAEIRKDLEIEKLRRAEQENFWRANADYWVLAHRQDRLRNWIVFAAIAVGVGIAIGRFVVL